MAPKPMQMVKNRQGCVKNSCATYTAHDEVGECSVRGCTFIGGDAGEGGESCACIGGGCISISMCISGADGGGDGITSSYFAGDSPLRAAILASCAATRSFTVSSSMKTHCLSSAALRYFLPPPGFLV